MPDTLNAFYKYKYNSNLNSALLFPLSASQCGSLHLNISNWLQNYTDMKLYYYTDYDLILAYQLILTTWSCSIMDEHSLYGELILVLHKEPILNHAIICKVNKLLGNVKMHVGKSHKRHFVISLYKLKPLLFTLQGLICVISHAYVGKKKWLNLLLWLYWIKETIENLVCPLWAWKEWWVVKEQEKKHSIQHKFNKSCYHSCGS